MTKRKIIEIDGTRCDGCGQCALACAEGAIEMRDGKARVVSDVFCDGLGACIGECPRGALRIVEREAPDFDEHAVQHHLEVRKASAGASAASAPAGHDDCGCPSARPRELRMAKASAGEPCGCESAEPRMLRPSAREAHASSPRSSDASEPCGCASAEPRMLHSEHGGRHGGQGRHAHRHGGHDGSGGGEGSCECGCHRSTLAQWPVQMRLVPPGGPFFAGKPLTVLADCAAVACPTLHRDVVAGTAVALACPKFEDGAWLNSKLEAVIRDGAPSEVRVVVMEVPCCRALARAVEGALAAAGSQLKPKVSVVSVEGELSRE